MTTKQDLRDRYKSIREGISNQRRERASQDAKTEILEFSKSFTFVFSFMNNPEEIDLFSLNESFLIENKLCLPAVVEDGLHFFKVRSFADLKKGRFDIFEPKASTSEEAFITTSDLILVPGIVFDLFGHRVGYGKGYYDRFLKKNPSGFSIGIGFKEQLTLDRIYADKSDQMLQSVFLF